MSRAQKKDKKEEISSLPFNSKTHATLNKKTFVCLYVEDLYFLTIRAGWKFTKIYDDYTFKQDIFKREFVVMNQNARKTAKSKSEKDFNKLLNNSNFGNDIGNCKIDLLYDGLEEINYIKKFTNILQDHRFRKFFTVDLLKEQIIADFNQKIENLDQHDPSYDLKYNRLAEKKEEELQAVEQYSAQRKRKYQYKKVIDSIENKIKNCDDIRKNKMVVEFNDHLSSSVKSIAVKSETNIKCTSWFMSEKLLMFVKPSLKSFVYTLTELLHFPEENLTVASIYEKSILNK